MTHHCHGRLALPTTLDELALHVPRGLVDASRAASEALRRVGVPHALAGGLAVGLRGYPRPTRDVDFILGDEAVEHRGLVTLSRAGLPVMYQDVSIDWVCLEDPRELAAFGPHLVLPREGEVPVLPAGPLAATKLLSGRMRDQADVVEMLKSGDRAAEIRAFVDRHFPERLPMLDRLARRAGSEE
jgi:hypothetical protein